MSGATLTGKGVNTMLTGYLSLYENYLKKVKAGSASAKAEEAVEEPAVEETETESSDETK
jgi:Na+-transporting NADH:ubiquinone oxidoreductase subunit C